MLNSDLSDVARLSYRLGEFRQKAGPYASREALNKTAFEARREIQHSIGTQLTERNAYTRQSIRVDRASSLSIPRQKAVTGSTASYFDEMEYGTRNTAKNGSEAVPLASAYAAGQRGLRTRLATKRNRMRNIELGAKLSKRFSGKQLVAVTIKEAVRTGQREVYLDLGKTKGLFRVVGGSRLRPGRAKLRMIYDLSRRSTPRPRQNIFTDMYRDIGPTLTRNYEAAIDFQLRRLGWL